MTCLARPSSSARVLPPLPAWHGLALARALLRRSRFLRGRLLRAGLARTCLLLGSRAPVYASCVAMSSHHCRSAVACYSLKCPPAATTPCLSSRSRRASQPATPPVWSRDPNSARTDRRIQASVESAAGRPLPLPPDLLGLCARRRGAIRRRAWRPARAWRIARCQPLCTGGFDEVPQTFTLRRTQPAAGGSETRPNGRHDRHPDRQRRHRQRRHAAFPRDVRIRDGRIDQVAPNHCRRARATSSSMRAAVCCCPA